MKNLFTISEEEKLRILEMHSAQKVITEQTLGSGSSTEIKRGDLINLYDNLKKLDNRYIVLEVSQDTAGVISLKVKTSGGGDKVRMNLTFRCADEMLTSDIKETDPNTPDAEPTAKTFTSTTVVPALRRKFCQKNKAGQWVPKAAFASLGTPESQMV